MGTIEQRDTDQRLAVLLRQTQDSHDAGQYHLVLKKFKEFGDIATIRSGFRVDAICYAARAHIKLDEQAQATALLKRLGRGDWTNATLFGHIAMVYLEMRDYEKARDYADQAAQLQLRAKQKAQNPAGRERPDTLQPATTTIVR